MTDSRFYGAGFPYMNIAEMPGKLIVLEGNDGVGRSTQMELLKQWLEVEGYGVSNTGLARSPLTQPGLDEAKAGHTLGRLTMNLFYATDFADRLENHIIPALSAGFCVLSDRYFYSIIARNVVRGADSEWARKVYGFALKPDIIFYLKANIDNLVKRVLRGRGFDYWESGMDVRFADNLYDSFVKYQNQLTRQFNRMSKEFGFVTIDANRSVQEIFEDLKSHTKKLLEKNKTG